MRIVKLLTLPIRIPMIIAVAIVKDFYFTFNRPSVEECELICGPYFKRQ
ncbi:MAG: hypothetical protein HQK77_12100 [Desulfobacterales bacterium]|nr:hypothetical protein [Desulfobacterales bacterium]